VSVLAAGQLIADRYQLDRRIAVGGMGEVWQAADTRLGRDVAVKVLRAELSDDPEFLHRFRIEARTVASLDHSGIAAVHDYGEDRPDGGGRRTAYLVMELVRGEPLSAVIARGPIAPDETLRIIEEAARAQEYFVNFVSLRQVTSEAMRAAMRHLMAANVDGVVFVADARPAARAANQARWHELHAALNEHRRSSVPIVLQHNHTDAADALDASALQEMFGNNHVHIAANAATGVGVLATLQTLGNQLFATLQ